ncbi:NTP transferase domain-containing protein [candidate division WOR-3 bacterium]|uniref:NTP transferase domain-containing protein n=1 Tax=candidate division WOR-3 bacterium TaxID=2052148 RepID=A0A9D5KCE6_UNCW3|nr:NTP transferase domain-containing protein [candidate division WOR-3 bacterium]MBD3365629.1 NTP transferase domain-containing protein [candidate division WOR-3 bacterium]
MTVIILAAGKGKRMKSAKAKVLVSLLGRPMISHIMSTVQRFSPENILLVVSPSGHEAIKDVLGEEGIRYVIQSEARGTADAVKLCEKYVQTRRSIVLCGDVPLIRPSTLSDMIALHQSRGAAATLLSTEIPDPSGYGRILRNGDASVRGIIEHKDASTSEREIREINSGTYVFESGLLFELLKRVEPSPATGEYYLTDVVAILVKEGHRVEALKIEDQTEVMGVNDFMALKKLEDIYRHRLLEKWSRAGAVVSHPQMLWADIDVELAPGTRIIGRAVLRGNTSVGPGASVGPYVSLEDTVVEGNNRIKGVRSRKSS